MSHSDFKRDFERFKKDVTEGDLPDQRYEDLAPDEKSASIWASMIAAIVILFVGILLLYAGILTLADEPYPWGWDDRRSEEDYGVPGFFLSMFGLLFIGLAYLGFRWVLWIRRNGRERGEISLKVTSTSVKLTRYEEVLIQKKIEDMDQGQRDLVKKQVRENTHRYLALGQMFLLMGPLVHVFGTDEAISTPGFGDINVGYWGIIFSLIGIQIVGGTIYYDRWARKQMSRSRKQTSSEY
jgi:hypothetical protein